MCSLHCTNVHVASTSKDFYRQFEDCSSEELTRERLVLWLKPDDIHWTSHIDARNSGLHADAGK